MNKDPYQVLGISPSATDDEVKAAYRELAKKYHPDRYDDNPLSDLAQEKMQEINEAYDAIVKMRRGGSSQGSSRSQYQDIRNLIRANRLADAGTLLDGIPASSRDAEWHFLKGVLLYQQGWFDTAADHMSQACQMDPSNPEYRAMFNRMQQQRAGGGMYAGGARGCSGCDMCQGLLCADCCCECMGGDLIRCC